MLENTPWFVAGPDHSAAVARQLAYQATSGATGIGGPADFRVRQTSTPSENVQILGGSYVIKSTYASYQSYTGRSTGAVNVEIPASGSSGSKTWYVGIQINDPEYPGTTAPAEGAQNTFAYAAFVVRSSRTNTKPWLPLAKVVVPANTATITNAMITNLREVANPRREEVVFARPRVVADGEAGTTLGALVNNGGEYFPGGGGSPNQFKVDVPSWATRVVIDADWMSVRYDAGDNAYGQYWIEWGDEYRNHTWPDKQQYERTTQRFQFDSPGSSANTMRTNWRLMDALLVPSHLRGKSCTFVFKAGRAGGSTNRAVSMDHLSGLGMKLTFVEVAIDEDTV